MVSSQSLRTARSFYFLYYGAWACLLPFLALYYRSLGFSGTEIGILTSISPLTTLLAAPIWSGLADASQRHKRVLVIALAGAILSVLGLSQARQFWSTLPAVIGYAFFAAPIIPLVDHSVLASLGKEREKYGRQRLWGAIGWGLAGPAAGWLVDDLGQGMFFVAYIVLASLTLLAALGIETTRTETTAPFWHGLRSLLANRRWFVFLLVVYLGGSGLAVISNYLFVYLAELNTSSTMMGIALTIATISEIPVLFFSGQMVRRWGPRWMLVFSLVCLIVRILGYSFTSASWLALLLQLLHGPSFSVLWVAGVNLASEIAPPGLGATAQGMFNSTVMGLGGITGALVGGLLLDEAGAASMFRVFGVAVLTGLLLFLTFSRQTKLNAP